MAFNLSEAFNLFGFKFKERKSKENGQPISFAPPQNDDGAMVIEQGGAYSAVLDLDGVAKNEIELLTKYREMAQRAEVDGAVSEIVNESVVTEEQRSPVNIVLDKLHYSDDIKAKITEEFDNILNLLDFNNEGQDIFRKWYVDGRLYFHMIIDNDNPRDGIKELRYIDPRRIKPVIETVTSVTGQGVPIIDEAQRYYIYNQFGTDNATAAIGTKVAWDSICYVHSGLQETNNTMILGHLHKAMKPANMLMMVEDATVIYRLSRAPERRVFYIDVGNLPKAKAEQYLKDIMSKYRNKMVYDATTGEIREDKKFLSFMEDYWLPRREGGRGTEISTLPGGENLGEMADVEYFKEKLYQSLNVPVGRLKSDSGFNLGRSAEISRDEVKFGKFIYRIRNRFTQLFDTLLSTQLRLKGIVAKEDWQAIRQKLFYSFLKDTYFSEMKNLEIMRERLSAVDSAVNYVGKYYPHEYIRRNILQQTDEEIRQFDALMDKEKNDPRYQAIEAMTGMGPMGMDGGMGMGMDPGMGGGGDFGGGDEGGEEGGEEGGGEEGMPPAEGGADGGQGGFGGQGGGFGGGGGGSDEQDASASETGVPGQTFKPDSGESDEDDESIDPDDLPTERITRNLEALWKK
jgi:hypothetical protein